MTTANRLGSVYDPMRNRGVPYHPFIYIGFVKDNKDGQRMGRLAVWIPEIGGDPNDEASWIIASYCSPFAGATDIKSIQGYTTNTQVAQQSYGLWLVPPDLNCEVAVFFANGDVSRAYWIGCTYSQFMNKMVPGIAVDVTTEPGQPPKVSPVIEYNKADKSITTTKPRRPPFQPLTDGLKTEGLDKDNERGPASTSARREAPSQVFGLLTPRGNTLHVDDNPQNEFIRLRTRSGTQVLIDETTGMVYINSKTGNAWLEISDAGVDCYSKNSISFRAEQDFNIRADKNIIFDAGVDVNIRAGHNISLESKNDTNHKVGHNHNTSVSNNSSTTVNKQINIKASDNFNMESKSDMNVKSGSNFHTESSGNTTHKAGGVYYRDGGKGIYDNSGNASGAANAASGRTNESAHGSSNPNDYQPYVGKYVGESTECVGLVKAVANLPNTSNWHAGAGDLVNNPPPIGTPIATFNNDGTYANSYSTSHAAIYMGPADNGTGFKVLEQFNGQPAQIKTYYSTGGGPGDIHNANNYRVINT